MILTERGEPIDRIISLDTRFNMATVELTPEGRKRPVRRDYFLSQLRADGGKEEIRRMAEQIKD